MAKDYHRYLLPPAGSTKKSICIAWSQTSGINDRDPKRKESSKMSTNLFQLGRMQMKNAMQLALVVALMKMGM